MTLQDFITKYNGQTVRGGQCGELVRQYWIDVDKTTPPSYTNSKDYWFNPVSGYDKVSIPQAGDIAIYDGRGAYTEGHSAIYVDGRVFEQNADPDGSPAHLFTRSNTYLLGYLRKQGGNMPASQDKVDATTIQLEYNNSLFRNASPAEVAAWVSSGVTSEVFQRAVGNSNEHRDIQQIIASNPVNQQTIADLKKQIANIPPADPNSITVTQSGLWAAFKRFLNIN